MSATYVARLLANFVKEVGSVETGLEANSVLHLENAEGGKA
jgi:hypothetical protein